MRYGIVSDTHANIEALEAVFKAMASESIDRYVCLGDTVGYGASPNETCDLMRQKVAFSILGNHDAAVAGRMDYSYYYFAARHALDKHARELKPDHMEWLKSLPYEVREGDVHFCHGSPLNIEEFDYIFARDQAAQCMQIWETMPALTVIGHSHLCKAFALNPNHDRTTSQEVVAQTFELRPGWKYIISVGSVGQPRDFDPRASYVIYDTDKRVFEFKRVEYDVKSSADKILATDLEPNFGTRLYLGI
ncbi:MAG: metallophosphoesterase family protein [Deltaproteobacteria bacterium]|nr:metallophosphoesterase family protein [Deltaproteobacteria bacterium]